jgi:hypothetical protein
MGAPPRDSPEVDEEIRIEDPAEQGQEGQVSRLMKEM